MNKMFNEVNVLMLGLLLVSLDHDKKKASVGKGKDMQGLKQHILTDRRKCILGHTVVKEIFRIKLMLDLVTFCSD